MTIRKTSYDTTLGSAIITKPVEQAIKEAFIKDLIWHTHLDLITSLKIRPVFITGRNVSESNIPYFVHPILVSDRNKAEYLCADIRPYVREDSDDLNEVQVRNQAEFTLMRQRMVLNLAWLNNESSQLRNTLSFAEDVFAAWISEAIAKRYALDPADQMTLTILAHYYYQSLFYPEDKIEEETLQKIVVHTMKATKVGNKEIFAIFDQIQRMRSIDDFCLEVKRILNNVRLEELNTGMLITMLGNTWYSQNNREVIAVALEHPPTWIAVVLSATNERGFKNSRIGKLSEAFGKGEKAKNFNQAYHVLEGNYLEESDKIGFNSFE
jgi:hypothetical protein